MDLLTLRALAGFTQARAAELAGVSLRTWRRWERGETRAPAVVWRWLRYESGRLPGWPADHWWARDGVAIAGDQLVRHSTIEAVPWLLGLLEPEQRPIAYRLFSGGA